jgi:hypothetical protein
MDGSMVGKLGRVKGERSRRWHHDFNLIVIITLVVAAGIKVFQLHGTAPQY